MKSMNLLFIMKPFSKLLILPSIFFVFSICVSFANDSAEFETPIQQAKTFFVQFRIVGLETNEQATTINNRLNKESFINVSRTDVVSSSYFAVLEVGETPHRAPFEKILNELGYQISCFSYGEQYKDNLRSPNTLKNCEDE